MLVPPNKPPELAAGAEKGTTAGAYNAVFAFVRIGDRGRVATGTRKFRTHSNSPVGQVVYLRRVHCTTAELMNGSQVSSIGS